MFSRIYPDLSALAVVFSLTLLGQARALENSAPGTPAPIGLMGAAQLKIHVAEYPNISGDIDVSADNTIALPVLGRISIAGVDAAGLERLLQNRVLELTGRNVGVGVIVSKHQPVFVTGFVQTPGSYPYIRDMTVLKAVTLAGGAYRAKSGAAESDPTLERLEFTRALSDLKYNLARWARLEAQRDGADRIDMPERLIGLVGTDEAGRLIGLELATMKKTRELAQQRLATIDAGIQAADRELQRLNELSKSLKSRLSRQQDFMAGMRELREKDLLLKSRYIELENALADVEEKSAEVWADVARAEASRLEKIAQKIEFEQTQRAAVDDEFAKIEAQMEQLQLKYEVSARKLRIIDPGAAGVAGVQAPPPLYYGVVRARDTGAAENIAVTPFSRLLPGDIVVVCPNLGDISSAVSVEGVCVSGAEPQRRTANAATQ